MTVAEKADFKDIVKELDNNDNETRYLPFPLEDQELPDIFMTSTPQMMANFKEFGEGQFVTFDVTYNLIKEVKMEIKLEKLVKKWG